MRCLLRLLGFAVAFFACAYARAQTTDPAAADVAFTEGKALMAEGRVAEACPKFAASHRLDPGVGVLFYLGDCYVKLGRVASAWATYREALLIATAKQQQKRIEVAKERVAELEPRLPKLTVEVPHAVDQLEVRRDAALVEPAIWGSAVPIDPGSWTIVATAPGHETWTHTFDIAEGQAEIVTIPKLKPASSKPVPAPAPPPIRHPVMPPQPDEPTSVWTGHHTAAVVVGGAGLIGVIIGSALGISAVGSWEEAQEHCVGDTEPLQCDATGVSAGEAAADNSLGASIALGVGGAGLATGLVLWLTSPSLEQDEPAWRIEPLATPQTVALRVRGWW